MGRTPKGKPLTLRPIRLDEDVWAECQRLGKEFGTINEGLRAKLLGEQETFLEKATRTVNHPPEIIEPAPVYTPPVRLPVPKWKRGPRQKGDKSR